MKENIKIIKKMKFIIVIIIIKNFKETLFNYLIEKNYLNIIY